MTLDPYYHLKHRHKKEPPPMPTQMEVNELHARMAFYRSTTDLLERIAVALETIADKDKETS